MASEAGARTGTVPPAPKLGVAAPCFDTGAAKS